RMFASTGWFDSLPLMLNFTLKTASIFFIPAIILSMVSPAVIKLTLADLGKTGGVVGTIYAFSTTGAIFGTFMTGFYLIPWLGTRNIIWLIAAILLFTGLLAWFSWPVAHRWKTSLRNLAVWASIISALLLAALLFQFRATWQEVYTEESSYYTIRVLEMDGGTKVLTLDQLVHSYNVPGDPLFLKYDYLQIFEELVRYLARDNPTPRVLHLGGGGYSFPQYLQAVYPESMNDVIEIDPAVTRVAYRELGLPADTPIKTYNQDARYFLMKNNKEARYDFIVGDVFNDFSTPYHLTTLEFARLVKANLAGDGVYLLNIIGDYSGGTFLPEMAGTLGQVFDRVYLFGVFQDWDYAGAGTFVIAASDREIPLDEYRDFITESGKKPAVGVALDEQKLREYLAEKQPALLTDDYAPTDVLVLPLLDKLYWQRLSGR
ncbi:MAG: fused MFS/spermidine synthase, partial [Chloroflexi bacterium]|nr:fused MFS/spermidine synthase [Chloroflexota bacterium]